MKEFLNSVFIIEPSFFLAIFLALFFGAIIGMEREMTNKWAGLRTHILVSIGSCAFTLLSIHVFPTFAAEGNPQAFGDPARIAAQIITGIGFIGGGTVLRQKGNIHGLTTASTLWITASIGMACGCEKFNIAFYTTILAVAVLIFVRVFEKQFIHKTLRIAKTICIKLVYHESNVDTFIGYVKQTFAEISELSVKRNELLSGYEVAFSIVSFDLNAVVDLYDTLNNLDNVSAVSVKESCD